MESRKPNNIDEYISWFPENIQNKLTQLREVINKAAPNADEIISYGMPAFYLKGNLVYFAAHKKHIGFYPTPSPIKFFKAELKNYKTSKGAIQLPFDKPLPKKLITKIVKFRAEEHLNKLKTNK